MVPNDRSPHPTDKKCGEQKGKVGEKRNKKYPVKFHGLCADHLPDLEKAKENGQLNVDIKE